VSGTHYVDDVLTFYAVTTRFDTGAATDADSVPTYRVYEEETGTPLLTGSMALLDSGNTAGLYSEQITLSAANGFEVGKSYSIYKEATVNGIVGATVESFVIRKKPLTPTIEGRELDVSAGGEAGVDWANVGSPTTTVGLSGTTVKTATDVETDTQDIQARLPAALTGDGNIKADALRVGGTLQTAGDIIGDTNDIQSRLPAALVSGRMASDAVAISGSTAAADAVEANIGNLDAAVSTRATQASVDTIDDLLDTEIAAIKAKTDNLPDDPADQSLIIAATNAIIADTQDIQARLPAALVSGRIDASVGAMGANVITAAAIAADAITDAKVASDVTIASVTGAVGSVTGNVGGNVVGSVGSVTAGVTLAASAIQAIWDALTAALTTVGSIGKLLVDNINATISSRATPAQVNTEADTALADVGVTTAVTGRIDAAISSRLASAAISLTGGKVTPIDVDGLTHEQALTAVMAVLMNVAAPSGSTVAFKKRDGTTTFLTITYGASDGERTASVL
jgi:hypothetical protein